MGRPTGWAAAVRPGNVRTLHSATRNVLKRCLEISSAKLQSQPIISTTGPPARPESLNIAPPLSWDMNQLELEMLPSVHSLSLMMTVIAVIL